jgi:hypothetical protein
LNLEKNKKKLLVAVIVIAIALNVFMFCYAYPEIRHVEFGSTARDFSAYYIGAWRLFNNPTQVYHDGALVGDYVLEGVPQPFKYVPSFLILMIPFLALKYMDALVLFDFLQLALMPLLAFFVYRLVKDRNVILGCLAVWTALACLWPTPASNIPWIEPIHLGLFDISLQSFAPAYYCGYFFINAHVLQAVLLVASIYFGYTKKPLVSALLFTFGLMDPRAAFAAVPLLLWHNRQSLHRFLLAVVSFIAVTSVPFLLYYDVGLTFLRTVLNADIISQSYAYDWIPTYSVLALTIVETVYLIKTRRLKRNDGLSV